jgi:hypothetical protein
MYLELQEHLNDICFVSVPWQTKEQFLWVLYAETERVCPLCLKSFWQVKYSQ